MRLFMKWFSFLQGWGLVPTRIWSWDPLVVSSGLPLYQAGLYFWKEMRGPLLLGISASIPDAAL